MVHGADRYRRPVRVDDAVLSAIEELAELAPLHNPAAAAGIRAAWSALPDVAQVAVFDTAYHATLPPAASTYALDRELSARYGIRRYGFHGISVRYVVAASARLLGRPVEDLNLVVLHLGNGASATAVAGGSSVDTSMGMTPLEGLVMGTRTGDIDPAVAFHLARIAGLSVDEIEDRYQHAGVSRRFCCRTAWGPKAAIRAASCVMRASSSSSGTTSWTSPQLAAVAASIVSPVSSSHAAREAPIMAGIRAAWITDGMPTATSGMPKAAPAPATRRSQETATSSPAPRHQPERRAMTGAGQALTASHSAASLPMKASAAAWSSPAISLMSAPPMNALSPAPRSTMTRQSSSRESL